MSFNLEAFYHHYWRECDVSSLGQRSPEATDVWVLPGFNILTPQELQTLPLNSGCKSYICPTPVVENPPIVTPIPSVVGLVAIAIAGMILVARRKKS